MKKTTFRVYAPVMGRGHQQVLQTKFQSRDTADRAAKRYGVKALVVAVR